jgi:hypothetical protein
METRTRPAVTASFLAALTGAVLGTASLLAPAPAAAAVRGCIDDEDGNPLRRVFVESEGVHSETGLDGCVTVSAPGGATKVRVKVHAKNPVVKVNNGYWAWPLPVVQEVDLENGKTSELAAESEFFVLAEHFRRAYEDGLSEFAPWGGATYPTQSEPLSQAERKSDVWIHLVWPDLFLFGIPITFVEPSETYSGFPLIHLEDMDGMRHATMAHELGHALHFAKLPQPLRDKIEKDYLDWINAEVTAGRPGTHSFDVETTPMIAYLEAFGCFAGAYEGVMDSSSPDEGPLRHQRFFEEVRKALAGEAAASSLWGSCRTIDRSVRGERVEGALFLTLFYDWAQNVGLDFVVDQYVSCQSLDVDELATCVRNGVGAGSFEYEQLVGAAAKYGIGLPPSTVGIRGAAEDGDLYGVATATGDFDGDGHQDLAVGASLEGVGTAEDAGMVHVIYGTALGLKKERNQILYGSKPGMPDPDPAGSGASSVAGSSRSSDNLGAAVAAGDFDGDGFDDLAIGVPRKDVLGSVDQGQVVVLYGSPLGLDTVRAQSWQLAFQAGARFGASLAVGNFGADGPDGEKFDDLAIGAPDMDKGAAKDTGKVFVLLGTDVGLAFNGVQILDQDTPGISGADAATGGERFGAALAVANFDGYRDDLAIGVPGEDVNGVVDVGTVNVVYARPAGLDPGWRPDRVLQQGTCCIPGTPVPVLADSREAGDRFGSALATGDFDGDGHGDLAVGVPQEDFTETSGDPRSPTIRTLADVGVVHAFYGSPDGLRTTRQQLWTQNIWGVSEIESGDLFGSSLAAVDLNVDGVDELVIGTPGEDVVQSAMNHANAGAATQLRGVAGSGLGSAEAQRWTQAYGSMPGTAGANDAFGYAAASGDFNGDGRDDLAIGIPGETVSGHPLAGSVLVMQGGDTSKVEWNQDR